MTYEIPEDLPPFTNDSLSDKTVKLINEFRDEHAEKFVNWANQMDKWDTSIREEGKGLEQEEYQAINDIILDKIFPHYKTLLSAGTTAVNAALTVTPTWFFTRAARSILREIKTKMGENAAERFVNEIDAPLADAPLIPEALKETWVKVIEALRGELAE